jgi:hypothetical protein
LVTRLRHLSAVLSAVALAYAEALAQAESFGGQAVTIFLWKIMQSFSWVPGFLRRKELKQLKS